MKNNFAVFLLWFLYWYYRHTHYICTVHCIVLYTVIAKVFLLSTFVACNLELFQHKLTSMDLCNYNTSRLPNFYVPADELTFLSTEASDFRPTEHETSADGVILYLGPICSSILDYVVQIIYLSPVPVLYKSLTLKTYFLPNTCVVFLDRAKIWFWHSYQLFPLNINYGKNRMTFFFITTRIAYNVIISHTRVKHYRRKIVEKNCEIGALEKRDFLRLYTTLLTPPVVMCCADITCIVFCVCRL